MNPSVEIRRSQLGSKDAGRGVFARRTLAKGTIVCLYPGIYSRGLPLSVAVSGDSSAAPPAFLGSHVTPSGLLPDHNEFILNVTTLPSGGYIDGASYCCPKEKYASSAADASWCCGHLINHSSSKPNVDVIAFDWKKDILDDDEDGDLLNEFLPNQVRNDGSPWYYHDGIVHRYSEDEFNQDEGPQTLCAGACFNTTRIVEKDEELLFDYKLQQHPIPVWAKDWYE